MIKDILQSQKNQLLNRKQEDYIQREVLLYAKKQLRHNLIKLITGPRRVGKSTLALQLLQNKKFGYVNFDDPDFNFEKIKFTELIKNINDVYDTPKYMLFDEIQNLPKWELFLNKLQRDGINLVVTGSNASVLSKDLATSLTGRAIEINLLPFSYNEVLLTGKKMSLNKYLINGSYPEVIVKKIQNEIYYQALFSTSIIKDIVVRYGIRNIREFESVVYYILANITNEYSYHSIAKKTGVTVPSTINYITFFKDSYMFYELPKFSTKQSEIDRSNKKCYIVDFALSTFNSPTMKNNYGSAFENATFIALLRKGFVPGKTLFFYNFSNSYEVDFVVVNNDRTISLYQACYSLDDNKVIEREVNNLYLLKKHFDIKVRDLILVTKDRYDLYYEDIKIIDFMTFTSFCKIDKI